jgi:F-type H+-transporting ATPase subunit b
MALVSLASGQLIAAAPLLAEEEAGTGGGGLFAINPGLIIWTWLIFILLLVVLRKWAWGPILGALEARETRIQEALDSAAREREEAKQLLQQQQRLLDESRDHSQQILADGRKAGERLRAELLEEGRQQREQILAHAKGDIERERDRALEVLRREVVDLTISAAGRVLQKEVDSQENRRIVEHYLDRLASEDNGGKAS